MIEAIRRAAPILATGVVVIAAGLAGFWVGESKAQAKTISNPVQVEIGRFQRISSEEAFDTKTAQNCLTQVHPPKGVKLIGEPSCDELASGWR